MKYSIDFLLKDIRKLIFLIGVFLLPFGQVNIVSILFFISISFSLIRPDNSVFRLLGEDRILSFIYILFVFWSVSSILWVEDLHRYFDLLEKQGVYLLPLFFLLNDLNRKYLKKIYLVFIGAVILVIFLSIIINCPYIFQGKEFYVEGITRHGFKVEEFSTLMYFLRNNFLIFEGHNTYFGLYTLIALLIIYKIDGIHLFFKIAFIALFVITILTLQSIIIYFLSFSLLTIFIYRTVINTKNYLWVSLTISVYILIGVLLLKSPRVETLQSQIQNFDRFNTGTFVERIQQYHCALILFKEKPILGFGLGQSSKRMSEVAQDLGYELLVIRKYYSIHNQFLHQLISFGLVGFILFFSLLFKLIYISIKNENILMQMLLVMFIVICLVESFLNRSSGSIFIVLFISSAYKADLFYPKKPLY